MPKGIRYQDASKLSAFRRKKKGEEKSLKKKKRTKRTEDIVKRLKKAGLSDADIRKFLDKGVQ